MHSPDPVAPFYGWLTWLNADGHLFADASRESYFMFGAGGHTVWVEPARKLVAVTRWMNGAAAAGFVTRVSKAVG
jgi:CubicO group peptidase (beta-lactamase class C family)